MINGVIFLKGFAGSSVFPMFYRIEIETIMVVPTKRAKALRFDELVFTLIQRERLEVPPILDLPIDNEPPFKRVRETRYQRKLTSSRQKHINKRRDLARVRRLPRKKY